MSYVIESATRHESPNADSNRIVSMRPMCLASHVPKGDRPAIPSGVTTYISEVDAGDSLRVFCKHNEQA
jgi:hypothetical protein